jgi:excinuclease ABC subunit A
VRKAVLEGYGKSVTVKYRNRYGRERSYTTGFEGVVSTSSAAMPRPRPTRVANGLRFHAEVPCPRALGRG